MAQQGPIMARPRRARSGKQPEATITKPGEKKVPVLKKKPSKKKAAEQAEPATEDMRTVDLVFHPALQMRETAPATDEYEELLAKSKGNWPFTEPLRGIRIKDEDGTERVYIYEGFTRGGAAKAVGRRTVPVEVTPGTFDDAKRGALAANAAHGYRRTNRDKAKAVECAIKDLGLGPTLAAQACKVSRSFVYEVRAKLDGKGTTRKAKAAKEAEDKAATTEVTDQCPVCNATDWTATASGYECANCKHSHGEPTGDSGEELEFTEEPPLETIEDAIVDATEKSLAKAETARGKLIRALDECGLLEACEKSLMAIGSTITKARKANRAEA